MMGRRRILSGLALAAAAWPLAPWTRAAAAPVPRETYWGSGQSFAGQNYVAGTDGDGALQAHAPLPDRGHALAVRPGTGEAVICARRPGTFLAVVDLATGAITRMVDAPEGHHYQGHAVYSPDGRLLFVTENAFAAARGAIGVYDAAAGYARAGTLPSHELDPHDIVLAPGGRLLAVANGGILTHPDFGRTKLNLDTMSPSLAIVDARDGSLAADYRLPAALHQLSIRHVAVRADGLVAVAMQHEGPETERPPLVGLLRGAGEIRLLEAPAPVQARMANYCGAVTFDATGAVFAASHPRGGLSTFWDAEDGTYLGLAEVADGCGIAPDGTPGGFILSSGAAGLWRYSVAAAVLTRLPGDAAPILRWDNHLTRVAG